MRRFLVLYRSLLVMNLRNRVTLFWGFAFPMGLMLLYGAIWGKDSTGSLSVMSYLMTGIVVLNIMSSGFMGDSSWLTRLREQGILLRVHATPLPSALMIAAYMLVRLTIILLQSVLIIAVAVAVYSAPVVWAGIIPAALFALLGAAVFVLLGQAIASLAPTSGAAAAVAQVIYFPLMFISNLFLPLESLPDWLQQVAHWSPAYLLVDLVRPQLVPIPAQQPVWLNLSLLLIYGALGIMIAARFFRWEPRR